MASKYARNIFSSSILYSDEDFDVEASFNGKAIWETCWTSRKTGEAWKAVGPRDPATRGVQIIVLIWKLRYTWTCRSSFYKNLAASFEFCSVSRSSCRNFFPLSRSFFSFLLVSIAACLRSSLSLIFYKDTQVTDVFPWILPMCRFVYAVVSLHYICCSLS